MENILIKTSQNGTTFTDLKTPSSYDIDYEDLDNESYRSVVSGNLIRYRLKPRWVKLQLSYNLVSDAELNSIAQAINTNQKFYVRCKSPVFGNMGLNNTWVQFQCYCSNFKAKMVNTQAGWNLTFNIIQSDVASFQN